MPSDDRYKHLRTLHCACVPTVHESCGCFVVEHNTFDAREMTVCSPRDTWDWQGVWHLPSRMNAQ